jgi:hypothetical protein
MEVRWTVHIPQALQQHGVGPRVKREETAVNATPALETKAGDPPPQSQAEKAK